MAFQFNTGQFSRLTRLANNRYAPSTPAGSCRKNPYPVYTNDPLPYLAITMIGVLGRVTSRIREGGTGEITFSQAGGRRSAAARSDDGAPIPRDADVLVTRYEKGIAYVRRFEDLSSTDAKEA